MFATEPSGQLMAIACMIGFALVVRMAFKRSHATSLTKPLDQQQHN